MFCLKCGAQNRDGAKFCNQCGAPLTEGALSALDESPAVGDAPEPPAAEAPRVESQPEPEGGADPEGPRPEDGVEPEPAPGTDGAAEDESAPAPGEESAPAPDADPTPEGSPVPPESWGSPVTEAPPQEWPGGEGQAPFQEGGKPGKGLGTGAIVGIIVAGAVVVALIVTAVLFFGGSSGGSAGDPVTREEPSKNVEIEGFGEGLGALGGGSGSDPDPGPDAVVGDEIGGSVFDLTCYEGTPAEIEEFLLGSGLTVSGSWASDGGGVTDPYVSLTFSGEYDGAAPIEMEAGSELEVSVQAYLGSTPVTWDDLGYADDVISSLNDLADDAEISGIAIEFYSPVESSEFASAAGSIFSSMELPAATRVSASSDDILSSTLDELGVGEDRGDVTDYLGEVLFVDSDSMPFRDGEGSCQVSLMGGEEFGGVTMVEIDLS